MIYTNWFIYANELLHLNIETGFGSCTNWSGGPIHCCSNVQMGAWVCTETQEIVCREGKRETWPIKEEGDERLSEQGQGKMEQTQQSQSECDTMEERNKIETYYKVRHVFPVLLFTSILSAALSRCY